MNLLSSEPLKGKTHQFILEHVNKDAVERSMLNILEEMNYKVKSHNAEKIVLSKGNRVLRLLFGAFIKYNKLHISFSENDGNVIAVVSNDSSGFSGGMIGMAQIKKEFKKVIESLEDKLTTSIY